MGNLWKFMLNLWRALRELSQTQTVNSWEVKRQTKHYQATQKNIRRIYFAQDVWGNVKHIPPPPENR